MSGDCETRYYRKARKSMFYTDRLYLDVLNKRPEVIKWNTLRPTCCTQLDWRTGQKLVVYSEVDTIMEIASTAGPVLSLFGAGTSTEKKMRVSKGVNVFCTCQMRKNDKEPELRIKFRYNYYAITCTWFTCYVTVHAEKMPSLLTLVTRDTLTHRLGPRDMEFEPKEMRDWELLFGRLEEQLGFSERQKMLLEFNKLGYNSDACNYAFDGGHSRFMHNDTIEGFKHCKELDERIVCRRLAKYEVKWHLEEDKNYEMYCREFRLDQEPGGISVKCMRCLDLGRRLRAGEIVPVAVIEGEEVQVWSSSSSSSDGEQQ